MVEVSATAKSGRVVSTTSPITASRSTTTPAKGAVSASRDEVSLSAATLSTASSLRPRLRSVWAAEARAIRLSTSRVSASRSSRWVPTCFSASAASRRWLISHRLTRARAARYSAFAAPSATESTVARTSPASTGSPRSRLTSTTTPLARAARRA